MKDTKAHRPSPNLFRTIAYTALHTHSFPSVRPTIFNWVVTFYWWGSNTLFICTPSYAYHSIWNKAKIYDELKSVLLVLAAPWYWIPHWHTTLCFLTMNTATTCQALCTFVYLKMHWHKSSLLQISHLNSGLLPGTLQYLSLYHSLPLYSFPL